MIKEAASICNTNFAIVDSLTSIRRIIQLTEKGYDFFIVTENNSLLGILTCKDILQNHPNRIAIDALKSEHEIVNSSLNIWEAYEKINSNRKLHLIVVDKSKNITGIIDYYCLIPIISKYIDPLTGLYKSDFLYYQGIRTLKNGEQISILFLDINEFGQINKKYGHINGNIILSELSTILKQSTPSCYSWCRFGGDEFALIAPIQIEESIELAKKIVSTITEHQFSLAIPVSISIGIAGGKQNFNDNLKVHDQFKIISNLLNKASLESTKAKKYTPYCLSVRQYLDISEIA